MSAPQTITLRRIKAGSLFKLVFLATATVIVPLFLFFGLLALFGANTVSVAGEHVTGIKGLVSAVIMAPLFVIIFSLFAWFGAYVGIRCWGLFRPLSLEYVPAEEAPIQSSQPPLAS